MIVHAVMSASPNTHGLCEWMISTAWTDQQLPRGVRWFGATPWGPQFIDLPNFACSVVLLDKSSCQSGSSCDESRTKSMVTIWSLHQELWQCVVYYQNVSKAFQDSTSWRMFEAFKAQKGPRNPKKRCSSPVCHQLSSLLGSNVCDKSMMGQPISRPGWCSCGPSEMYSVFTTFHHIW